MERLQKLDAIAQTDKIYCLWEKCYQESAAAFAEYANNQPEDIRNMLWTYAESGRLMYQRKAALACTYMEFKL